jgi:eukaryotic-like serine/threonine-protein kinase
MTSDQSFGPFLLVRQLREALGAVSYKARLVGGQKLSATLFLKVLPQKAGERPSTATFVDAARTAAALTHPNIASVFDFGQVRGRNYIAVEYVAGRDLGTVLDVACKRGLQLPVGVVLFVAGEICKALSYYHKQTASRPTTGNRPRLSPLDVLVALTGEVKLRAAHEHAQLGTSKLALGYLAPEQALGSSVDHRAGVFSLGVLLLEALTGRPLFSGGADADVLRRLIEGPIPKVRELRPEVPPDLERVVTTALAREPTGRYASVEALQRDLAAAAATLSDAASAKAVSETMRRLFPNDEGLEAQEQAREISVPGATAVGGQRAAADAQPFPTLGPAAGGPAPGQRKVLVVDDARTIREVVKVYLMGNGFTYIEATNGRDGLELARNQRPSLIISDVSMPQMTGLDFCRAVKNDANLRDTPFVLVTSLKDREDRELGKQAGANAYLTKPVDVNELARVVAELLRS